MEKDVTQLLLDFLTAQGLIIKEESTTNRQVYYIYNIYNNKESNYIEIDSLPTNISTLDKNLISNNNTLPLKVQIMQDLAKGTYVQQISTLLNLWRLLFGTSEADAKTIATLVGKFGGYKSGGCTRLAREMLQLANWDGNPTGILMGKAKGNKQQTQVGGMYPDYGKLDTSTTRTEAWEDDF